MLTLLTRFRRRFWQPPRAHGEVEEDRVVSFLELFYDLVYVVVIATIAAELAHDISWRHTADFVVLFGLIWIAWVNGAMFHDVHGRNDARTRTYTFVQMALIALLAVYAGEHGEEFSGFAIVYSLLFGLFAWLWYTVRRQDGPEYGTITARYIGLILLTVGAMAVSVFLDSDPQLVIWAAVVIVWVAFLSLMGRMSGADSGITPVIGESTVERFGLFTIIVLGEVVVGVVEGLTESTRDFQTMVTGILALTVGFGLWWNYFDTTGRRLPREDGRSISVWLIAQLPLTMSIAAAGASMVSLVEHGSDNHAPEATTWLLVASISIGLVSLAVMARTLRQFDEVRFVYHPASIFTAIVAIAILPIGLWQPAPWLLALSLAVALSAVWWFAIARWLTSPESGEEPLEFH